MGEFETTAAAPFRHSHQTTLARANLLYYFTLEKRWMSSDDAKKLISLAAARGCYIEEKEGEYTLAEALQDEKIYEKLVDFRKKQTEKVLATTI